MNEMASLEVIYTVFYGLFSLCLVFPPTEFVSSGLTIQSLFSSLLGSEDLQFVEYNIRRTTLTALIHSLLPLGYFLGLSRLWENHDIWNEPAVLSYWSIGCLVSIGLFTVVALLTLRWRCDQWSGHPLAKTLALYADGRGPWTSVAADVNVEFRRIDKFASSASSMSRVVVTDSWLIRISPYSVRVVHQSDVNLSMTNSQELQLTHLGSTAIQFLTINVESTRRDVSGFTVRLNSLEYSDFKEKLRAPIRNARSIVVHLTLSDRFVDAFKTQVMENPAYQLTPGTAELENCIGCMQNMANIKLQKLCEDNDGSGDCVNCYCRPMWCIDCMGKWFASRQDQTQPATWLSSKSPCPTCRSTFCILDVCLIQSS